MSTALTNISQEIIDLGKKKLLAFGSLSVLFGVLAGVLYIIDKFVLDTTLWVLSGATAIFMILLMSAIVVVATFWILVAETWNRIKPDELALSDYVIDHPRLFVGFSYGFFTLLYFFLIGIYFKFIFPENPTITTKIGSSTSTVGLSPIVGGLVVILSLLTVAMWKEAYDEHWKAVKQRQE